MKNTKYDGVKLLEQQEAGRKLNSNLPVLCRIDGKNFSRFTRDLIKPFDSRLVRLMDKLTEALILEFSADLGYTQSDEITLLWKIDRQKTPNRQLPFDGKIQKLTSVIASYSAAFFALHLEEFIQEKANTLVCFDARIWNVTTEEEVDEAFMFRMEDATRNSISMLAQTMFSHKSLQGASCREMVRRLTENGTPWEELSSRYKYGMYVRYQTEEREMTPEELAKIPERHRPQPGEKVRRRKPIHFYPTHPVPTYG